MGLFVFVVGAMSVLHPRFEFDVFRPLWTLELVLWVVLLLPLRWAPVVRGSVAFKLVVAWGLVVPVALLSGGPGGSGGGRTFAGLVLLVGLPVSGVLGSLCSRRTPPELRRHARPFLPVLALSFGLMVVVPTVANVIVPSAIDELPAQIRSSVQEGLDAFGTCDGPLQRYTSIDVSLYESTDVSFVCVGPPFFAHYGEDGELTCRDAVWSGDRNHAVFSRYDDGGVPFSVAGTCPTREQIRSARASVTGRGLVTVTEGRFHEVTRAR